MAPKLSFASRMRWLMLALALPGALWAADLQIEHVTIVSPERSSPMRDALVRVHDGRIVAISTGSGARARSSKDTIVMDGSGLYLAPGLIDSHVHVERDPRHDARARSRASGDSQGRPRADSAQLPAVRFHHADRSDLDAARDGALEKPRHRARHVFCGGAALMDGYSMNYAPKPQRYQSWALHVDRARYPCTRRDRSSPAPRRRPWSQE